MKIFEDIKGKSLEDIFRLCKDLLEDPDYPTVKKWRQQGGKVLGHFQVYFPEELAHAAGLLPVKVKGGPVEPRTADSRFGSYLCSILKTSLEFALSKRLELDMFVAGPICDAARNLAAVFGRNMKYPCQIMYLTQNPNSQHAVTYMAGEYARVLGEIERIAGHKVTAEALRKSIAIFNTNRSLLQQLYAIKRSSPWLVSVDEAYALMTVGTMIPREEHNELLKHALHEIKARAGRLQDKIRVVFVGGFCEQPPLDLLRVIGLSCYVVDDDLMIGLRYLTKDVALDGDPLTNLADAYINHSEWSPVQHDLNKPKEHMLIHWVERSQATAVIVTSAKMCEPGLDEQVAYSKTLEEKNIPYFVSEFEENMTSFDHMAIQLETFAENILFE